MDDAFITFRYAENLVNGHGLVFNSGGQPVEGYSNFLWLLLLSLLYKIGLPTLLSAKVVGLVSFLCAGLLWYKHYEHDENQYLWLAGPLFILSPITVYWGLSGLELGLHALLFSLLYLHIKKQSPIAFLIIPLFILSRPEAIALALLMFVLFFWFQRKEEKFNGKFYYISFAIAITLIAALTIFRMSYFGYPLPNTFYAKSHHNLIDGYLELWKMLLYYLPFTLGLIIFLINTIKNKFARYDLFIIALVFLAQALISASVDPVQNYFFRYMSPFLILIIITLLVVIDKLSKPFVYVSISLGVLALLLPSKRMYDNMVEGNLILDSQMKTVAMIKEHVDPKAKISISDMGRIPYYTDNFYYDIFGLMSQEIGHDGFITARELQRFPEYFIFVGYVENNQIKLRFWREQNIGYTDIFKQRYKLVFTAVPDGYKITDYGYYYLVFERI